MSEIGASSLELELRVLVGGGVDRFEMGAEQQGVAVARLREHVAGRDHAGGGRLVLHDDALAERVAELVGDEARRDIGRPAGAEADDQPDRPRRIGLLRIRRTGEREQGEGAAEFWSSSGTSYRPSQMSTHEWAAMGRRLRCAPSPVCSRSRVYPRSTTLLAGRSRKHPTSAGGVGRGHDRTNLSACPHPVPPRQAGEGTLEPRVYPRRGRRDACV